MGEKTETIMDRVKEHEARLAADKASGTGPQGKSLDEYVSNLRKLGTEAFAEHRIMEVDGGLAAGSDNRWVMRGNQGSMYWVEVVRLAGDKLLVHGDICAIIFAYGNRRSSPRELVAWMGRAGLDHAKEKASIGTGSEVCEVYDSDLAIWELRRIMNEAIEYNDRSTLRFHEEVEQAIDSLANGDPVELVVNGLYSDGLDPELLMGLGRAVSPRVVYAHAAVQRLDELLTQQEKEEEHGDSQAPDTGGGGTGGEDAEGLQQ
jgi:hypothetical protein